jgi:CheY-like chemotaxis protein
VPKTLLAVDDSATMRKVLEITFAGEDFRVLTADGGAKALNQMSEEPVAVVIDLSLEGDDPYALAREVRSRDSRAAIVLMASRYNPYDSTRGKGAGADDFIDKPFDTATLIDKVKKAILAHEAGAGAVVAAAPPPPPPPPPAPAPQQPVVQPFSGTSRGPGVGPGARPAFPAQRTSTLSFEGSPAPSPPPAPVVPQYSAPHAPPMSRTAPSGVPVFQPPAAPTPIVVERSVASAPTAVAPPPPHAHHAPAPVAAAVNGQLAGKLGDLGLSAAQVEAVLALSREVVERVVWEVVPLLAETMIKEELTRLTKE